MDAMFPEMSRLSASGEGMERLRALFRTGGRAMLAGGFLLAIGGALGAGLLVPIVYGTGEDRAPTVLAFRLLVWAIPAMFLVLLSGHALYAVGQQRRVTVAMLVVGVANLAANLIAIPRWGHLGAAGVALASEWLLWAILYGQARRALNGRCNT
jgi:O-antigen/teichoic acid export membrane protein